MATLIFCRIQRTSQWQEAKSTFWEDQELSPQYIPHPNELLFLYDLFYDM